MRSLSIAAIVAAAAIGAFGGTYGLRSATSANPTPATPVNFTAAQQGDRTHPAGVALDWDDAPGSRFQLSRDGMVIYTGTESSYKDLGTGWVNPTTHYVLIAIADGHHSAPASTDVADSRGWGLADEIATAFPTIIGPSMPTPVWREALWTVANYASLDARIRYGVTTTGIEGDPDTTLTIWQCDGAEQASDLFAVASGNLQVSSIDLGKVAIGATRAYVLFADDARRKFVMNIENPNADVTTINQFVNSLPL